MPSDTEPADPAQATREPIAGRRAGRAALRIVALGSLAVVTGWAATRAVGAARSASPAGIERVVIDDPRHHWVDDGFVLLEAALAAPTNADGTDQTAVWIRVPDGGVIRTRRLPDGRITLAVPPGTVLDRVESIGAQVADVRGTRFGSGGRQVFHVLRPEAGGGDRLVGYEWVAGDEGVRQSVTDLMASEVARRHGPRSGQRFAGLMDCAGCHPANKPASRVPSERGLPNRPTDDSGLYQLLAVLNDETALEFYRARNANVEDPFVSVGCAGGAAPRTARDPGGTARVVCSDQSVPVGRLDLVAALDAGDARARRICRSRMALASHLDDVGRQEFAAALRECAVP